MARLIEIQDVTACRAPLSVRVGDVLSLRAVGVRIESGSGAVGVLGPFTPALVGDNGEVLAAMGGPRTVLLQARQVGNASITVIGGDPFHAPTSTALRITVEA
jgi:hypothetical protein